MAQRVRRLSALFPLLRLWQVSLRFWSASNQGRRLQMPQLNYLSVFVAGLVIFLLGGMWYSPILFSKRWVALQGRTEEQMRAEAAKANMPVMYFIAFVCGLIIAWGIAVLANHFPPATPLSGAEWAMRGAKLGLFSWFAFVAPTSFANATFSTKPKALWVIDSGYNLVAFLLAGVILMTWR
ncbi:MAG: hypothetical protein DMD63_00205 [Gemmatimonadetes bacterium]|nr:MAG: hypothetical protein DMD63_00205 [Gemmatimonadota bacterium]